MNELEQIDKLYAYPPGTHYKNHKGEVWIRMQDSVDRHLESFFFNPKTGEYKHASRIA